MSWFARFLPALPPVEADSETREAVEARVERAGAGADAWGEVLLGVRDELLWPASVAWRAGCGIDDEELATEVLLVAVAGAAATSTADVDALLVALEPYVAFGQRERFRAGPAGMLEAARRLAPEREDRGPVLVSLLGHRLGLHQRRGGSEGWFLLATLAWIAGVGLAEVGS